MTWTMFLIFCLMALFGSLLAYGGDFLGRWFGKRRLTLFGIRPRNTAILITSLTGSMIVILTAGVLTLVNQSFRDWITRGDQILIDLKRNQVALDKLQTSNKTLTAENEQIQARSQQLQSELKRVESEYQQKIKEQKLLEAQLKTTENSLQSAEKRLSLSRNQLETSRRQLSALESEQARLKTLIEQNKAQIASLERRQTVLRRQNDEFAAFNTRLASENARLESENERLKATNTQLSQQNQSLIAENRNLESDNQTLTQRNDALRSQLEELQKQFDDLESKSEDLARLADARVKTITLQAGVELARMRIPDEWNSARIRLSIQQLLNAAARTATERGAKPGKDGRIVFIPEKTIRNADGTTITANEAMSLDAVANEIERSPEPVVIIATALVNCVAGEPVSMEILLYRDRLVYKQGDEIARTTVTAGTPAQNFNNLFQFLKQNVREAAIESGIIPILSPGSEEPSVGEINVDQLVDLLQRAQQIRGKTEITARAVRDTRAGESLQVEFEFKPVR